MGNETNIKLPSIIQGTMLVVDDLEISREILSLYFKHDFTIMEANNGAEALEILQACKGFIDIILLDLSMPQMDGKQFLDLRKNDEELLNIPVIVITASKEAQDELETFELGIDDYITKPFLPEIVGHRVQKVLSVRKNYKAILSEKKTYQMQAEIDMMTGLYNKTTTEAVMGDVLQNPNQLLHAMLVIDVDKFKKVNDTLGHLAGDKVITEIAGIISKQFRKSDIVGRIGGDEYGVLINDIPNKEVARKHARNLIRIMKYKVDLSVPSFVTLSIGIAYNDNKSMSYYELFEKADQALHDAKNNGKNQFQEFGVKQQIGINQDDVVLVYNSSRSICSSVEEALNGDIDLKEVATFEELKKEFAGLQEKIRFLFVDVSDEKDEGASVWTRVSNLCSEHKIPVIAITKEGDLAQYKTAIEANVKAVVENPIDCSYLWRRLQSLTQ